jgi:hypothetical protein
MIRKLHVCGFSAVKLAVAPVLALVLAIFLLPNATRAQGLEVSGGWAHVTQDFGTDGFTLGASGYFSPRFALVANYDDSWDTSRVGTFEFTTVGAIAAKSHLQNFLVGPRILFASRTIDKNKNKRIVPFADVRLGVSHLHQTIQQGLNPPATNQDSAFSWMAGGGVDYPLGPHLTARGELGLLRTHLNADAQSRARLAITLAYTFGSR